jgi:hypothetical protein
LVGRIPPGSPGAELCLALWCGDGLPVTFSAKAKKEAEL